MIKAKTRDGKLILGVDRTNIDRLVGGEPLLIKNSEIGNVEGDIIILFSEELGDIMDMLTMPRGDDDGR